MDSQLTDRSDDGPPLVQPDGVAAVLRKRTSAGLLLVAIDGHSAAGKSTLARTIQQQLSAVTIVHVDDFYRVMEERDRASLDAAGGYAMYYDWQRLESQVLRPLVMGQAARYQQYVWADNRLGPWFDVPPGGVIIVEGLFSLRPELRPYFAVKIWVETGVTTRMERQRVRADPWAWVERWDAAERFYVQQHRPQAAADLVVRA